MDNKPPADTFPKLEITKERTARHHASALECARAIQRIWSEQGEDIDSPSGIHAFRQVMSSLLVPERKNWMSPDMALATLIANTPGEQLSPSRSLDLLDAMRTHGAMTQSEKAETCGRVMGTTAGHIAAHYSGQESGEQGKTALYRHYDDRGVLLYVGIATNPVSRTDSHRRSSRWASLSVRLDIEWFDTRREALGAESVAIKSEGPVFNIQGSSRENREKAIDYLFDRLNR